MSAKDYWRSGKEFSIQMSALCGKDFTSQLKEQMIRNADEYERRAIEFVMSTPWRSCINATFKTSDVLENEPRTIH